MSTTNKTNSGGLPSLTSNFQVPIGEPVIEKASYAGHAREFKLFRPKNKPDAQGLGPMESVVIRLFTWKPEHRFTTGFRKATVGYRKGKDVEFNDGIKVSEPLYDPDQPGLTKDELLAQVYDDNGVCMADLPWGSKGRLPVWVRYTTNAKGEISEEINDLRFIQMGIQIEDAIRGLKEDLMGGNDWSDIPNYDIRITNKPTQGDYWEYVVEVVRRRVVGGKAVDDPYYGKTFFEAMSQEDLDVLSSNIDELLNDLTEMVAKETSLAHVKSRFLYRGVGSPDSTARTNERPSSVVKTPSSSDYSEDEDTPAWGDDSNLLGDAVEEEVVSVASGSTVDRLTQILGQPQRVDG